MVGAAASQGIGPVEQVDPGAWLAAITLLFAAWIGLLAFLIARANARMRRSRAALAIASRYGGCGDPLAGGHQPVAPSLVAESLIIGRLEPSAGRRIRHQLARHASCGDPRLRYGMPRSMQ